MCRHLSKIRILASITLVLLTACRPSTAVAQIAGIVDMCLHVDVSKSTNRVAFTDRQNYVTEWSAKDGKFFRSLAQFGPIIGFHYIAEGRQIVLQKQDYSVLVVDEGSLQPLYKLHGPYEVRAMVFSDFGNSIAFLSKDKNKIEVFGFETDSPPKLLASTASPANSDIVAISINKDGQDVAAVNELKQIEIFNTKTENWATVGQLSSSSDVEIKFLNENELVLARDGVQTYRRDAGRWNASWSLPFASSVIQNDARRSIIVFDTLDEIIAYRHASGANDVSSNNMEPHWWIGAPFNQSMMISPDGKVLYVCGLHARAWNFEGGGQLVWEARTISAGGNLGVQVSSNGRLASVVDNFGRTGIWDIRENRFVRQFPPIPEMSIPPVAALGSSPEKYATFLQGGLLAIAQHYNGNERFDIVPIKGAPLKETLAVNALFSADQQKVFAMTPAAILVASLNGIYPDFSPVIDQATGDCGPFSGEGGLSQDGSWGAFACRDGLLFVDLTTKQRIKLFTPENWNTERGAFSEMAIAMDPDNERVIIATQTQHVSDWLQDTPRHPSPNLFLIRRDQSHAETLDPPFPEVVTTLDVNDGFAFVGGRLGLVGIYDLKTRHLLRYVTGVPRPVVSLGYDSQMHRVYALGGHPHPLLYVAQDGSGSFMPTVYFVAGGEYASLPLGGPPQASYPGLSTAFASANISVLAPPASTGDSGQGRSYATNTRAERLPSVDDVSLSPAAAGQLPSLVVRASSPSDDSWRDAVLLAYVNGRLQTARSLEVAGPRRKFEVPIPIEDAEDGLRVELCFFSASLGFGKISSREFAQPTENSETPHIVGGFVGIGDYSSAGLDNLPFALSDAGALAETISQFAPQTSAISIFKASVDGEPSKVNITNFLRKVAASAKPNDELVLYLAGHGHAKISGKDAGFYFLTVNHSVSRAAHATMESISSDELIDIIESTPSQRILLLIDACDGGAFNESWFRHYDSLGFPGFFGGVPYRTSKSVYVAAASPTLVDAKSGWNGHGFFTKIILDGLSGGASEENSINVTASDLLFYISRTAPLASRRVMEYEINPVVAFGTADFYIRKH